MKIIVINDLPSDVFSEHLLGKKSFSLTRLRFSEIISGGRVHPDLFLMVNQKIDLAADLKKLYPKVKVVSVVGGKSDFQPVVTFIYDKHDHDIFTYSSWAEFDSLLLNDYVRQVKKLNFKHDYYGDDSLVYEVNQELVKCHQPAISLEFKNYLTESSSLSSKFIGWMTGWIEGAKHLFFPVKNFARQKNISKINLTLKNEYNGLPIFNKGDNINLLDDNQLAIPLLETKTTISNSKNDKISVSFSRSVIFYQLKKLKVVKPNLSLLNRKMTRMRLNLLSILDGFMGSDEQLSAPASFICSAISGLPLEKRTINYPREVLLDNLSSKILRDPSQIDAFLEMINDRPISAILGPAGTGKTFTSAAAICNLVRRGQKVLIVSHSNLGVDNLFFEVSKMVSHARLFRFGNDESVVDIRNRHLLNRHKLELDQYLEDGYGMVAACTIDTFLTAKVFNCGKFKIDFIFCDEASRGLYFEITSLILAARKKLVLIGDNRQLGNIPIPELILSILKEKTGLDDSRMKIFNKGLFNNLVESNYLPVFMLKQNRRSLPKISQLVSFTSYQNSLVAGRFNPYNEGKIVFLDTKKFDLAGERLDGHSMFNPIEVNLLIKRFIACAVKHVNGGGSIMDMAIIAPYQAQINLLKKKLRKELLFNKYFAKQVNPDNIDKVLDHLIKTVDSIQGGERKIVFVSLVRSNNNQEIGFNKDVCRLNVAMSRAQETLIIVGNSQTFLGCEHQDVSEAFSRMLKFIKKNGSYVVLK
jgi:hypothetical protein